MKALLLDAPGPPETLRLGEAQAPHAGLPDWATR